MTDLVTDRIEPKHFSASAPGELPDVLVLGGGLMAMAIALELRLRGAGVSILSRDRSAAAAYAAAGMLAPQAEKLRGAMAQLCLRSRDLYPDWTAKLEALSGLGTGYWASGILNPVFASEPQNAVPTSTATTAPTSTQNLAQSPVQWLDSLAIQQQQPGLSPEVVGGWWFPQDAQVNNRRLATALVEALKQTGVVWYEGVTVTEIEVGPGRQVRAIATDQGQFTAAHYVLAAGAWAGQIWNLPVSPVKGQMLSVQVPNLQARDLQAGDLQAHDLQAHDPQTEDLSSIQPLRQVLYGDHVYIVPRKDGLIVVGATSEHVDFMSGNTPAGLNQLLGEAIRLYPPLQDFPLVETWWGYRPATPDELPILGPSSLENLTLATGHHRNGVLLAPITAQLMADWILEQKVDALLPKFRWDRFPGDAAPVGKK